jgi:predicted outer membrane protein
VVGEPVLRSDRPEPRRRRIRTRAARATHRALGLLAAAGVALTLAWLPAGTAVAAPAPAGAPPAAGADEVVVETAYGPLTGADRDLLVRVRLAGLWEVPAGQFAAEKGTTEDIREIGTFIYEEHIELDAEVRAAAAELGVPLPDEPIAEHQLYLNQMAEAEGEEFDLLFIQYLREAHGLVYPLIAHVRAGTHNELIREFSETSETFVGRHMDYLESSGLVDWVHVAPPPEPLGTQSRFLASNPAGVHPLAIWIILVAAAVAGGVTTMRAIRLR